METHCHPGGFSEPDRIQGCRLCVNVLDSRLRENDECERL